MIKQAPQQTALMQALTDSTSPAIFTTTIDGRVVGVNRGAETLLGYTAAELVGRVTPLVWHDAAEVADLADELTRELGRDVPPAFEALAVHADGQSDPRELTYVRKNGSRVPVLASFSALLNARGECTGFLGVAQDLTGPIRRESGEMQVVEIPSDAHVEPRIAERHRAAENLRRMATVVRDSNDAITIQDLDGRITAWNRGAGLMYGYSEHEALQMNIRRLTSPGKVVEQEDFTRRLIAGQTITSFETQRVTKDGRVLDVWMTVTRLMDDAGTPIGIASTERDITERRVLEAQILQAQKMESVGQLAGGVAHDFNNLLTVINSTAELIASQLRATDPLQADIAEIRSAGWRAAALTRQLLAFSRKQVLQPQAVNLTALVADLQPLLRRLISEAILQPVALDGDLANVRVDPTQMEQVIVNLAVNARDAMPDGGTLTIETRNAVVDEVAFGVDPFLPAGAYVMLAVTDTGIGMDQATRRRLFEPFFTTKPPGRGTGLGLATVYGIVKQSDGSIRVTSEPGKGTRFEIYLPQVAEAARPLRPTPISVPARGDETILIVEDEESLRRVAQRVLALAGYTVLEATNGGDAMRLLERHEPPVDLVLTDVVMPGMSGGELASRIREWNPEMKILFTSGYADDAIGHHGVLDEGVHFLAKPYAIADLTNKVREVLNS